MRGQQKCLFRGFKVRAIVQQFIEENIELIDASDWSTLLDEIYSYMLSKDEVIELLTAFKDSGLSISKKDIDDALIRQINNIIETVFDDQARLQEIADGIITEDNKLNLWTAIDAYDFSLFGHSGFYVKQLLIDRKDELQIPVDRIIFD